MHAAVHARSIVDDNTAHHGRADTGWVRREYTPIRLQYLVHLCTHDTWLQFDGILLFAYLVFLPMLACNNQDGVSTTLA